MLSKENRKTNQTEIICLEDLIPAEQLMREINAANKTPWICKRLIEDNIIPALPHKRPFGKKCYFPPYDYVYDAYYDCMLCPQNEILSYATTNRNGYQEFKSNGDVCAQCSERYRCTSNQKSQKMF